MSGDENVKRIIAANKDNGAAIKAIIDKHCDIHGKDALFDEAGSVKDFKLFTEILRDDPELLGRIVDRLDNGEKHATPPYIH